MFALIVNVISECIATGFLPIVGLEDLRTLTSRKEIDSGESSALSAWHCLQQCLDDNECEWFSWQQNEPGKSIDH